VRLSDVIDRAVTAASPQGGGGDTRHLRIDRVPGREPVELLTDADRLTQVFINLIGNARKYCEAPEPVLKIRVRADPATSEGPRPRILVDFIDNGTGIPERSQDIIFEKFSRLTDTAAAGGAGLGLAICREIMARLGGDIAYLPGQGGAAFRLTVPLAPAAAR